MKPTFYFLLLTLTGCGVGNLTGASGASRETPPLPPPLPAIVHSPSAILQPAIAPSTNTLTLPPFIYRCGVTNLTNAWLESSTDLVNWIARDDFTANADGSWTVPMDPAKPKEFYRAGAQRK